MFKVLNDGFQSGTKDEARIKYNVNVCYPKLVFFNVTYFNVISDTSICFTNRQKTSAPISITIPKHIPWSKGLPYGNNLETLFWQLSPRVWSYLQESGSYLQECGSYLQECSSYLQEWGSYLQKCGSYLQEWGSYLQEFGSTSTVLVQMKVPSRSTMK